MYGLVQTGRPGYHHGTGTAVRSWLTDARTTSPKYDRTISDQDCIKTGPKPGQDQHRSVRIYGCGLIVRAKYSTITSRCNRRHAFIEELELCNVDLIVPHSSNPVRTSIDISRLSLIKTFVAQVFVKLRFQSRTFDA